jgi:hypothetical protein
VFWFLVVITDVKVAWGTRQDRGRKAKEEMKGTACRWREEKDRTRRIEGEISARGFRHHP